MAISQQTSEANYSISPLEQYQNQWREYSCCVGLKLGVPAHHLAVLLLSPCHPWPRCSIVLIHCYPLLHGVSQSVPHCLRLFFSQVISLHKAGETKVQRLVSVPLPPPPKVWRFCPLLASVPAFFPLSFLGRLI